MYGLAHESSFTADPMRGQSAGCLLISLCQNTVPSLMSAVKFTQSNSIVFTYLQVKYQFPSHEVHTVAVCCVVCPITNNNHTDHVMLSQNGASDEPQSRMFDLSLFTTQG
jgi:hypothetical protein